MPQLTSLARLALFIGAAGLLLGTLLVARVPQLPDGDATAVALYLSQRGITFFQDVRHALWWNLAGALFAWGVVGEIVNLLTASLSTPTHPTRQLGDDGGSTPITASRRRTFQSTALWLGILLAWGGWAWNQTRGWEGELYLTSGVPVPLGVDGTPVVRFDRFLIPPAPDGPGRALRIELAIDGIGQEIAEAAPYREEGWTLVPRWYGATVDGKAIESPLFFGADGTRQGTLRGGMPLSITVDVESLSLHTSPTTTELRLSHYVILTARFAPGDPLIWLGGSVVLLATLGLAISHLRPRP